MPESWTARGALLLTLLAVVVAAVAYGDAPPKVSLTTLAPDVLAAAALRPDYTARWVGWCSSLLQTCAAVWGLYGARNVVPVPAGWTRSPTSAELAATTSTSDDL